MVAIITILRLPAFAVRNPASGKEIMDPTGRAISTSPSWASDKPMLCWMLGIRDAQLAKHNPYKKNTALTAIRLILCGIVMESV